jgi:serine protease AprX
MPVYTCLDLSVPLVRAPQVWEAGYSGRSVRVAVLDTGLDTGHPDFAGRVVALTDFTGEGVRDEHGHGTHVAGIAAGAGHTYRGVAPEADLYVAKVLHRDGSGYMSEVLAGLDWAVQQRAQVVNISLGGVGPCDGTDALSAACDAAVDHGVVVCVAAGNYGPGASTVGPPGCARKPLTVGACSKQDVIAPFSARGPTGDGRIKPDLLMPGVSVASCRAQGTTMGTPVDSLYTLSSGTSMAAPHATGAVALLLEAFPDLSAAELKQRLVDAAQDLGLDPNAQGGGRADAHRAFLGEDVSLPPSPARGGCVTSVLRRVISRP